MRPGDPDLLSLIATTITWDVKRRFGVESRVSGVILPIVRPLLSITRPILSSIWSKIVAVGLLGTGEGRRGRPSYWSQDRRSRQFTVITRPVCPKDRGWRPRGPRG